VSGPTAQWDKDRVRAILDGSKKLRVEALLHLYRSQTDSEKQSGVTGERNGVGFSKFDAELLSSFAQQAIRRGFLSAKQMQVLNRRLPHYWRQLAPVMQAQGDPVKEAVVEKVIAQEEHAQMTYGSW
jgi:hypothetical protein